MKEGRARKQRTRASLVKAADELFSRAGVEDTTLGEVADKAGLHVQTLYRHFATKGELATAVAQSYLDRFQEEFDRLDRSQDTLTFWRDWVDRCSREATRDGGHRYRRHVRAFYATPTTSTTFLRIWYQYEDLLTRTLAEDLGVSAEEDPLPRLVACMLWSANVNAVRRWAHSTEPESLNEVCVAVVDQVIALFGDRFQPRSKPRTPEAKPSRARRASSRPR
jgi:AcrR family transcriptional regulator